ncbi:MAG: hypothetical protein GY862_15760 [Gammaproteobacteria bacterium]|nr:hypothetical protein [Gammaproteobacteria bacterium]
MTKNFDSDFNIVTVSEHGWSGKKNGALLHAAEQEFDALVTMDKGIEHQQNLRRINMGIVIISAQSNHWRCLEPVMWKVINKVLRTIYAREVIHVRT